MSNTDKLIEDLATDAKPVTPLASPLLRASMLLSGLLAAMALLIAFGGHVTETVAHLASMPFTLELVGTALAGMGAIVAAVTLSIPGRAQAWAYLPLPGIALWLSAGGFECYRVSELGYAPTSLLASQDCFTFIFGAGLLAAAACYIFLRRYLSVDAGRVTALAALGSALLAAALLQFFHAHGTNPVDFATHMVAVAVLMLLAMLVSRLDRRR